jgi:tagaturonate reductase
MPAYPVKLIQFGTGMLLRGLVDEIIHDSNKKNIFNGSVAVIKSTAGTTADFERQKNQYTVFITGTSGEEKIETHHINTAIAVVWQAEKDWALIQQQFVQPSLEFVVSNTTEAGLVYEEENIPNNVPHSFPAKLTALLYHRFQVIPSAELIVIATELIENNADVLKAHVLHHAKVNRLPAAFIEWLGTNIHFCNSLVDRIVTRADEELVKKLSYTDTLAVQTEPYYLWAIECKKELHNRFLFTRQNNKTILSENISYYRERKLRLLNGVHTFSACRAYLTGSNTVYDMMYNEQMLLFLQQLTDEMIPAVKPNFQNHLVDYTASVLERFSNPYLKHFLLDICTEITAKMKHRNIPLLLHWYEIKKSVPQAMAAGFAWYILFMKATVKRENLFYGRRNGDEYMLKDTAADFYYYLWKDFETKGDLQRLVFHVCKNEALWATDLSLLPGFADAVAEQLVQITSGIAVE